MSVADNQTVALWKRFMPQCKQLQGRLGTDFYSVQCYPRDYFEAFDLERQFEKWAAVAVSSDVLPPKGFKKLVLESGSYAVFDYQGKGFNPAVFQYIYQVWLPQSGYTLAARPHFEVLPENYQAHDPLAHEEIWIPIIAH